MPTLIPTFEEVMEKANQFLSQDIIPIGIIDMEYNKIRKDAFEKGLLIRFFTALFSLKYSLTLAQC